MCVNFSRVYEQFIVLVESDLLGKFVRFFRAGKLSVIHFPEPSFSFLMCFTFERKRNFNLRTCALRFLNHFV